MYIVLRKDEYDKLVHEESKLSLFESTVEKELKKKKGTMKAYDEIGKEDIVNELKHEYTGMAFVRDMFLILVRGD